eukprot:gb/GEZN01011269.1/.p1 GENE.gb/GEZN01011269.1/~~gb/GEZN01011269.1/.p1  ORF type:complete len:293 (+),score=49.13 gb/GEZN01011269.1/:80-958(+)
MSADSNPKVTLVLPRVQQAPPWKDLQRCMGCSEPFNLLRRHHHCRHCGGDFCYFCCNKETQIPKFGFIVSQARVCQPCYVVVRAEIEEYNRTIRPTQQLPEDKPQPPGWVYSKFCMACRAEFSSTVRDHHCRNCGRNFCEKCCGNFTAIPKFGWFLKQVRTCGPCLSELRAAGETNVAIVQKDVDGTLKQVLPVDLPTPSREDLTKRMSDSKVKVYQNAQDMVREVFGKKSDKNKENERREAAGLLGEDSVAAALASGAFDESNGEAHYAIGDDDEDGLDLDVDGDEEEDLL